MTVCAWSVFAATFWLAGCSRPGVVARPEALPSARAETSSASASTVEALQGSTNEPRFQNARTPSFAISQVRSNS
jgi:hypothetical protein